MQMEVVHIVDVIMGKSDGGAKRGEVTAIMSIFPCYASEPI